MRFNTDNITNICQVIVCKAVSQNTQHNKTTTCNPTPQYVIQYNMYTQWLYLSHIILTLRTHCFTSYILMICNCIACCFPIHPIINEGWFTLDSYFGWLDIHDTMIVIFNRSVSRSVYDDIYNIYTNKRNHCCIMCVVDEAFGTRKVVAVLHLFMNGCSHNLELWVMSSFNMIWYKCDMIRWHRYNMTPYTTIFTSIKYNTRIWFMCASFNGITYNWKIVYCLFHFKPAWWTHNHYDNQINNMQCVSTSSPINSAYMRNNNMYSNK